MTIDPRINDAWLLGCAALVFLMQAGFCCLETGLVHSKNSINVAIKNVSDFALSGILFWAVGFGLMFGSSHLGFVGTSGFFFDGSDGSVSPSIFLFQLMFCGTATTLVGGAIAERVRFSRYLVMSAIMAGIIYPLYGHWSWAEGGLLREWGFVDFAGSSVVHGIGAWFALAACMLIGPRKGRFGKKQIRPQTHSFPITALGVLLLAIGWIGFNAGSTLELNGQLSNIVLVTILASMSGCIGATAVGWLLAGRPEARQTFNGLLAGLVAITACCHVVSPAYSLIVGGVGGVVAILCSRLLVAWKIDDVVDAIPVHGFAGVWGTLCVALFGDLTTLGTGLDRFDQMVIQIVGAAVCFCWAFSCAYGLLWSINRWWPIRVSDAEEETGLNVAEHGERSELSELLVVMDEHQRTGEFNQTGLASFTDVGQIAAEYDRVVSAFRRKQSQLEAAIEELYEAKHDARKSAREIENLRLALDQHCLFSVTDTSGRIIEVNEGFCKLSGFDRHELIGQDHRIINSGHHDASFWKEMWDAIKAGEIWRGEVCNRAKDGTHYWVDATNIPVVDENGTIEKFISLRFDITEKKAAEAESEQAHHYLQCVLDAANQVAIIASDSDGVITTFNRGAERMLGYSASEMIGRQTPEIIHVAAEVHRRGIELSEKHGEKISGFDVFVYESERQSHEEREWTYVRKDGSTFTVNLIVTTIRDFEGTITGYLGVATDVSERKRAENAAAVALSTLDAQLAAIDRSQARCEFAIDRSIIDVNQNFVEIMGYEKQELVGKKHCMFVPFDIYDKDEYEEFWSQLAAGKFHSGEYVRIAKDGTPKWIQATYNAVLKDDGTTEKIVKYAVDITERKIAEEALEAAREQIFEQQDRVEHAIEGASDGLWDYNPRTQEVWYSRQFKQLIGLAPEQYDSFEGNLSSLIQRLHPEDRDLTLTSIENHLTDNQTFDVRFRLRLESGDYQWFRARGQASRDESGIAVRMSGSITDIQEQCEAENAWSGALTELERANRLMEGREVRIRELKREVNDLAEQLGRSEVYGDFGDDADPYEKEVIEPARKQTSIDLIQTHPAGSNNVAAGLPSKHYPRHRFEDAGEGLEKSRVSIAYIPIVCSAPLLFAKSRGFFENHGLDVDLQPAPSWSGVKNRLVFDHVDAAHLLAPMPIAIAAGLDGRARQLRVVNIQNCNGQTLTLATKHKGIRDVEAMKGFTFGVPYHHSMHYYLLCAFLEKHGLDPLNDVNIVEISPPLMPHYLATGQTDGIFAPAPFNHVPVVRGTGFVHTYSNEIWEGHPCCCFATSDAFAIENPNSYRALVSGILEAQFSLNRATTEERREIAVELCQSHLLDPNHLESVVDALTRKVACCGDQRDTDTEFVNFLPTPWPEFGQWIVAEQVRRGQLSAEEVSETLIDRCFEKNTGRLAARIGFDETRPVIPAEIDHRSAVGMGTRDDQATRPEDTHSTTVTVSDKKRPLRLDEIEERIDCLSRAIAAASGGDDSVTISVQEGDVMGGLEKVTADLIKNLRFASDVLTERNETLEHVVQSRLQQVVQSRQNALSIAEDAEQARNRAIETQDRLNELAFTDTLTGLHNRASIVEIIEDAVERSHNTNFALLYLDFDGFKHINDSLGHDVGDELLIQIAQRLSCKHPMVERISPGRMGGDEFVVLLEGMSQPEDSEVVASSLLTVLSEPYNLSDHHIYSTASIGIVSTAHRFESVSQILRDADLAMYHAKSNGKGRFEVFNEELNTLANRRMQIENDLRFGVARNEFKLVYQPIIELETGRIRGVESLLRWNPGSGLSVGPDEFIPIAEETGVIVEIGSWVIDEACRQYALWNEQLDMACPPSIHINVSRRQLLSSGLVDTVEEALEKNQVDPKHIHLEITESMVMEDPGQSKAVVQALKDLGVMIDIDDFGTGHSSLACLNEFPFDTVKLDRKFIADLTDICGMAAILQSILRLAHNLGLEVIAEGIEDVEQLMILQSFGCDMGQGYLFDRPLDSQEIGKKTTWVLNAEECLNVE